MTLREVSSVVDDPAPLVEPATPCCGTSDCRSPFLWAALWFWYSFHSINSLSILSEAPSLSFSFRQPFAIMLSAAVVIDLSR